MERLFPFSCVDKEMYRKQEGSFSYSASFFAPFIQVAGAFSNQTNMYDVESFQSRTFTAALLTYWTLFSYPRGTFWAESSYTASQFVIRSRNVYLLAG